MAEYDSFARVFAQTRKKHWPDIEELFLKIPTSVFQGDICDVGCGSGRVIEYFPKGVDISRYTGIDIAQSFVDIARESYPGVNFKCLRMEEIGQLRQNFDIVLFIASLQHICSLEEQKNVLMSVYSLLQPGGYIALLNWNLLSDYNLKRYPSNTPNPSIRNIPFQGNMRTYWTIDNKELLPILQECGYVAIESWISQSESNILTIARKAQ